MKFMINVSLFISLCHIKTFVYLQLNLLETIIYRTHR